MAEDVAADLLGLPTDSDRGRLYRNRGDGTFADVTREAGLYRVTAAMGLNYGDLDGDGFLDLYIGTGNPDLSTLVPNLMFRNDAGRRFQDVTTAVDAGHLQKGHGIAFGDVDDDGDQDVFEEMGGAVLTDRARSALYRNPGNANAFVGLELEGVRANRSALGARVAVTVDTERVRARSTGRSAAAAASGPRRCGSRSAWVLCARSARSRSSGPAAACARRSTGSRPDAATACARASRRAR